MHLPFTQEQIKAIRDGAQKVWAEAEGYFDRASAGTLHLRTGTWGYSPSQIWSHVPEEERKLAELLVRRTKEIVLHTIEGLKLSPLLGEADVADLRVAARRMHSALYFRRYEHWDTEVLHDEGTVLGVKPAGQSEDDIFPDDAKKHFFSGFEKLMEVSQLLSPSEVDLPRAIVSSEARSVRRYRPNTAFIMMWIDPAQPQLEDVKNCFKEVFGRFGITAIRSDEIEHQDVITGRILDEISTSEYLVADLTGERPSVYYEVGYAHAIDKRPILYRSKGTKLHFDLSVHNVPEYENITDLRKKLRTRLIALTNKQIDE
jgi:hypothetical protein